MHSTKYTLTYAVVLTVIVATCLALAATALRDRQERNLALDKKKSILLSIDPSFAEREKKEMEQFYDENVQSVVFNYKGEDVPGVNAFDIVIKDEMDKATEQRNLPLYIYSGDKGKLYIIPIYGKGLWGPIWGYVSLKDDMNTVHGVYFDHKMETPGLGAEIAEMMFQGQFRDKKIRDEEGAFVGIDVIKGGAPEGDIHGVDAISGATITSVGVAKMIQEGIEAYLPYFKKQKPNIAA